MPAVSYVLSRGRPRRFTSQINLPVLSLTNAASHCAHVLVNFFTVDRLILTLS
jgi:hypothetical protein